MATATPDVVSELDTPPGEPTGDGRPGSTAWKLFTTTDHKTIGLTYIITCFIMFFIAGLMALLIPSELCLPGLQFLSNEQYNQMFTLHGTIMLLFFGTPIVTGFGNYIAPLQIGAPTSPSPDSMPSASGCSASVASS